MSFRQGSNALDRCSAPERSSVVMLSAAKHLCAQRARCFAALSMTRCDGSHCQVPFGQIVPCLRIQVGHCMQAVELIRKKRDGDVLSTTEINWLVDQYTRELIPDYQVSAWLMAVYWRVMNARETSYLTLAIARSREELHLRGIISSLEDKHSSCRLP